MLKKLKQKPCKLQNLTLALCVLFSLLQQSWTASRSRYLQIFRGIKYVFVYWTLEEKTYYGSKAAVKDAEQDFLEVVFFFFIEARQMWRREKQVPLFWNHDKSFPWKRLTHYWNHKMSHAFQTGERTKLSQPLPCNIFHKALLYRIEKCEI